METRRTVLLAVIGVIFFLMYRAWQADYVDNRPAPVSNTESADAAPAVPGSGSDAPLAPGAATAPGTTADSVATTMDPTRIHVVTDKLAVEIAPRGGELRRVELLDYAEDKAQPERKLALLTDRDGRFFVLQSGLAGAREAVSDSNTAFTSAAGEYRLAEGQPQLDVVLDATTASGVVVHKQYRFHRGSYSIDLTQTIDNRSGVDVSATPYLRFQRTPVAAGKEPPFVGSFTGIGIYEQKPGTSDYRFESFDFKKLDSTPYESKQTGGWIAMLQHYFVAAIIPPSGEPVEYSGKRVSGAGAKYAAQAIGQTLDTVAAGQQKSYSTQLYIGPKEQKTLDSVAPGMELTENYGLLKVISPILFKVLSFFHSITGNWGWSIVLLTILVKASFFKLSEAQYRSGAKMRKFTPRLQELKERYAGDREKLSKATMELYKKEGFNPLAGCWPLLIQMPIFFGLYRVLVESVELRQAPFALWLNDLSAADPYYVLPVLYGFSMWVQQRLSGQNATLDPAQQKIMNVMPIGLTGLFLFFPVGLVLYWLVSNLIGIAQQWIITRRIEKEGTVARR